MGAANQQCPQPDGDHRIRGEAYLGQDTLGMRGRDEEQRSHEQEPTDGEEVEERPRPLVNAPPKRRGIRVERTPAHGMSLSPHPPIDPDGRGRVRATKAPLRTETLGPVTTPDVPADAH